MRFNKMFQRNLLSHISSASRRRQQLHPLSNSRDIITKICKWNDNDDEGGNMKSSATLIHHNHHNIGHGQIRYYHATRKQEIVPILVVGAAAVFVIGRYSFRALQRMDEEWDDYEFHLQQYERSRLRQAEAASLPTTIGVDLGTIYLKLAHSHKQQPQPQLVVTSQGDRYRFCGVFVKGEDDDDTADVITGRPALDKFLYKSSESSAKEAVVLPYNQLLTANGDDASNLSQQIIVPAVREAMDRVGKASNDDNELQSDTNVRTVLTLPPNLYKTHSESILSGYPLLNEGRGNNMSVTVPDPVAAVWGAQILDLLPSPKTKEDAPTILVVDVGGLATNLSLVQHDVILSSSTIDQVGGETLVKQLANRIIEESSSTSSPASSIRDDPMSLTLIQQQARASVMELVQKTQTKVHIPFLFMGRRPDDPHLDMSVSRKALEQSFEDYIADEVVPNLSETTNSVDDEVLSSSMPTPTDMKSLMTSAVTKLLEKSRLTPMDVDHILLVGGGARHNLVVQSCQEGIFALTGPGQEHKLVLPESSLRAELVALGAASLLPNFTYLPLSGLGRVVE